MKWVIKYWAQITAVVAVLALLFGWCWRLALRVEATLARLDQHEKSITVLQLTVANNYNEHDEILDNHEKRMLKLETIEDLREKRLMK